MAYSLDLKQKVVNYVENGGSKKKRKEGLALHQCSL
ncbi:IS630 transposase-related protein [Microcoleus sp. F6_B6]